MYYLMNENNKIIGADTSLLDHLKVEDLNDFLKEVALENISFEYENDDLKINFRGHTEVYKANESKAITLVGDIKVIYFDKLVVKDILIEEGEKTHAHIKIEPGNMNFDLLSEKIGVSKDDYISFIKDFINLANELKNNIHDNKREVYTEAVQRITNLADMLSIGYLTKDLLTLTELDSTEKKATVNDFYVKLNSIFNDGSTEIKIENNDGTFLEIEEEPKLEIEEEPKLEIEKEPKLEIEEEPKLEIEEKEYIPEDAIDLDLGDETEDGLRPDIDLSNVEPVHFDFQMSHAADDLGIPVEIIEEFVLEYIDQAEEETVNLIKAYREGDLKKVQEIGHLLKGAASNLRIDPLAKTLYDIQFCEDIDEIEKLTKIYWAKFLSFRNQIKK